MPNPVFRHIEPILPGPSNEDAATAALLFTVSGTEFQGIDYVDSGIVYLAFTPSIVEVIVKVYDDFVTAYLAFTPSAEDVGTISDSATTRLKFTFSATEVPPPIRYFDSAIARLKFYFGVDDCHAILTPHWHLTVLKRWNTEFAANRWSTTQVSHKWSVWIIGVSIDTSCPDPTLQGTGVLA